VVLETMPKDARDRELLYQHDTGLSRVRRIIRRQAEAQVDACARAGVGEFASG